MVAQIDNAYIKHRPYKLYSRLISYALFEGRPLTTRGQWINLLVFAHFAIEKRLPQVKKVIKPVFVLGTGRSGTTILGILMSMHKDIGYLNEPKALWHSIYPNEDVIGSYSRGDVNYRLDESYASADVVRSAHRLFGFYLASTFSGRVVDKYPEIIFRVPFIRAIFPDAKFLFLVRNGWETIASIEKWSQRHKEQKDGEVHDWWGVNGRKWKLMLHQLVEPDPYFSDVLDDIRSLKRHTDMAALEWVVTMREGLHVMGKHGDAIHRINYEELVTSPKSVLGGVLDFCGLRDDPTFFSYALGTLRPPKAHAPVALHPAIKPLFEQTLTKLGY